MIGPWLIWDFWIGFTVEVMTTGAFRLSGAGFRACLPKTSTKR